MAAGLETRLWDFGDIVKLIDDREAHLRSAAPTSSAGRMWPKIRGGDAGVLRKRTQYRLSAGVFLLILVGVAFYAGSLGRRASFEQSEGAYSRNGEAVNSPNDTGNANQPDTEKSSVPPGENQAKINRERPKAEDEKMQIDRRIAEYTNQLAGFTAYLVIVTLLLAVVGIVQAYQLGRTVDSTERSQRILERAYVFGGPGIRHPDKAPFTHFGIAAKNQGKTPAFLKEIHCGYCRESEFSDDLAPAEQIVHEDVLPPNGVDQWVKAVPLQPLPKDETWITYGHFIYEDVFHIRRISSWRHRVHPGGGDEPLPGAYSNWS